MKTLRIAAALICAAGGAVAGPLDGKSYIIELTSSQFVSGSGQDLVPPLFEVLSQTEMVSVEGPEADIVINIVPDRDDGRWVEEDEGAQVWLYTVSILIGISPGGYRIPEDGTPVFGVRAVLETPNPDREDELACLIGLAARAAVKSYQPEGLFEADGSGCLREASR
ncbi:MAG: hypothetical protein QNJ16_08845 [Rhodobacter sp.]|nr:hypothetical protein [Rhodobacter sp.]